MADAHCQYMCDEQLFKRGESEKTEEDGEVFNDDGGDGLGAAGGECGGTDGSMGARLH